MNDPIRTHWEGCYTDRAHHACAVAMVERLRDDAARLDWLERYIFVAHWCGTIGVPPAWSIAGPARHAAAKMIGRTFRDAIDAAMEKP